MNVFVSALFKTVRGFKELENQLRPDSPNPVQVHRDNCIKEVFYDNILA